MTLYSYGFNPTEAGSQKTETELQLFSENLPPILKHETHIISCAEYFFCPLKFAFCGWAYVSGGGPLYLGYLLLGWREGMLTGECVDCGERILVVSFGGSVLSGSNSWRGICESCRTEKTGRWEHWGCHVGFVMDLRKRFPAEVCHWEEYDTLVFSWNQTGLEPGRRKRLVRIRVAESVTLETLIDELKTGNLRQGNTPNLSLLNDGLKLKFSKR
jgi:hypothetical protein